MVRKIVLILLSIAVFASVITFGASENSVDRELSVKDDYEFNPTAAYVNLRIEEKNPNEFGDDPFRVMISLENAEWFEDSDSVNCSDMENDTVVGVPGSTVSIQRVSSKKIYVTLDRNNINTDENAYWKIPIYAKVVEAGELKLVIDGLNGYVSSESLVFGRAIGDSNSNSVNIGFKYDMSNNYWITVKEPYKNAFGQEDQTFRLELNSSEWFETSDEELSPQKMMENSKLSGVEDNEIKSINRISDKIVEVTLNRGNNSSINQVAVWSIPLYHVVTDYGDVNIKIDGLDSLVKEGTFTKDAVIVPVVKKLKVINLQINRQYMLVNDNGSESQIGLDVAPINRTGITMVPLRGILEELNAVVEWKSETKQIEIKKDDSIIVLKIGSDKAIVDNKEVILDEIPRVENGRTLIPLRFISENLGYSVKWNQETSEILIY